jgi:hypothetical protein
MRNSCIPSRSISLRSIHAALCLRLRCCPVESAGIVSVYFQSETFVGEHPYVPPCCRPYSPTKAGRHPWIPLSRPPSTGWRVRYAPPRTSSDSSRLDPPRLCPRTPWPPTRCSLQDLPIYESPVSMRLPHLRSVQNGHLRLPRQLLQRRVQWCQHSGILLVVVQALGDAVNVSGKARKDVDGAFFPNHVRYAQAIRTALGIVVALRWRHEDVRDVHDRFLLMRTKLVGGFANEKIRENE